ncbi:hypothetical protein SMICM304S_03600 [Streptomyces microflavus]
MDTAGRRAVVGLPSLLDAPAEIGETTAHVIGRTRDLRSGLVILLLGGPRNQIGAGNTAGQPGSGDPAGSRLLDPLGLSYEFVVGEARQELVTGGSAAPRWGMGGTGTPVGSGAAGAGRSGACWPPWPGPWNQSVSRVSYSGVRPSPGPAGGRASGCWGSAGTVRGLARRRTRGAEVVAVPAALTRCGQPRALVLLERRVEVGPRELGGARRVLGLLAVPLALRRVEVGPGELRGRGRGPGGRPPAAGSAGC